MIKSFIKTVGAVTLTVLFFSEQAIADNSNQCMALYNSVKSAYTTSDFEATVIDNDQAQMQLYALAHFNKNSVSYTTWKSLNNEIAGYALRQDKGFDYNHNRSYIGPLSWHQTQIWDRIFSKNRKLTGYDCTIVGRTRLAGRKVTVIRMSPVDDVRYSYVISKDDDTSLPVELVVLSPAQIVASKFTVSAAHSASSENLSFPDETFDRVEKLSNKKKQNDLTIWPELTIPKPFTIESAGIQKQADGTELEYQSFTDGMVEFKVYKNSVSSLNIQSATDGTLTVLRRNSVKNEYAVVGEIPLELSAIVLSKITPLR